MTPAGPTARLPTVRRRPPRKERWFSLAKYNVLLTAWMIKPDNPSLQHLQTEGCEIHTHYWHDKRDEREMIELVPGMDAAIVSIDPFTPRVLAAADRLKVISRTGIGYDNVDVPAASAAGKTRGAHVLAGKITGYPRLVLIFLPSFVW